MNRASAIVCFGLLGTVSGSAFFWAVNQKPAPVKTAITEADVQHFLDEKSGALGGSKFREYFLTHYDTPAPKFELPEVAIADPEMWDWTDHKILRGDREVKGWAPKEEQTVAFTSSSATITSACYIPSTSSTVWINAVNPVQSIVFGATAVSQ